MQILANLTSSKDKSRIQIDKQNYKVYLFEEWSQQTIDQQRGTVLNQEK